jgi:hypothetical protein
MESANMRRSQVILRMPVDNISVTLILHDGVRSDAMLFVPPTEDIARLIGPHGERFLPMFVGSDLRLVARDAIACIGMPSVPRIHHEGDLPVEVQRAGVTLRSGVVLEGELRWTGVAGQARTADYLNADGETIELHTADITFHIVKSHIAMVTER